jgi:hypothetical protein
MEESVSETGIKDIINTMHDTNQDALNTAKKTVHDAKLAYDKLKQRFQNHSTKN